MCVANRARNHGQFSRPDSRESKYHCNYNDVQKNRLEKTVPGNVRGDKDICPTTDAVRRGNRLR